MSPPPLTAIHAAATLAMGGLIWFVQLVHYPLFPLVAADRFVEFARAHQRRTGWVVMPLMAAEAVTATLLVATRPGPWVWAGWLLLVAIWLSTALVQVPLHRRLAGGYDPRAARKLVTTNWLRTALWSVRAVIALLLL